MYMYAYMPTCRSLSLLLIHVYYTSFRIQMRLLCTPSMKIDGASVVAQNRVQMPNHSSCGCQNVLMLLTQMLVAKETYNLSILL